MTVLQVQLDRIQSAPVGEVMLYVNFTEPARQLCCTGGLDPLGHLLMTLHALVTAPLTRAL